MIYTKGKWAVSEGEFGFDIEVNQAGTIGAVYGNDSEAQSNANLIASAPDTYKVAKEVVDYIETNGIDKWSDKEKEGLFVWGLYKYYAKDAVAKAEGK